MVQLAKKTVKENLTVRQLEQLVSELNGEKNHKKAAKRKVAFRSTSEKERRSIKGTLRDKCCDQKHGTLEKGKIEISYLSMDDLNRILDILDIHLD